mmetsp:Transcript_13716/g.27575  ORF Transcript_13716/g.27575 Transcript_13716/m.27575 type:complete len:404 (-) Transcript_13716:468-1679(-)|eukprot:CAMPEP_0174722852 /NCGR_PEP_ID=MMETSP1094-20130205/39455_1 /TAXON_ID=156173 /ORGANISM="Chrysochromulina brevifilum, Strain UTEX LB 985" /LENGTH=403 /DNA_ID=CAMNT_0015923793 /DNA_START=91 /DNA_END=1302 /DNA_ORIENTATION=-
MTQERTPLAVVATAVSDQVVRASAVLGTPQSADWWAQKKRKRTVACGQCDACCRNDCGACLNCLDKPKFGGNGIRKQSCLERKCRQPAAAPTPSGGSSSKPAVPPQQPVGSGDARGSMPPQEWDAFWSAVECCMLLQGASSSIPPSAEERGAKRGRTNRCGSCAGCLRGDCGACKNCKDKPKFGGKGIKKQACIRRGCTNPLPDGPEDEDEVHDGASQVSERTTHAGFLSAEPSPPFGSTDSVGSNPPDFELGGGAASASGLSWLTKAASSDGGGSSSMLQDTRRRLQQLRAQRLKSEEEARPLSSMSMGYSTADEYEAGAAEPGDDDEVQSATEDLDEQPAGAASSSIAVVVEAAVQAMSDTPPCKLLPASPSVAYSNSRSAEALLFAMAMAEEPSAASRGA